jgi:branched-chain amino acid transport system substrate-binding protein
LFQVARGLAGALRPLSYIGVILAACGTEAAPIRIGLAGPLTDSVGAPMGRAAVLAVQEINAAGGIAGRPIELILRDDHGDPDSAIAVAIELERAGVVAVVGHVSSSATLAAAPVYNGAARPVVQISPSSSAPEVTRAGAWTFRICPSDFQHGAALARFARNRLGLSRGTILYLNNEYGRGIRSVFAAEFVRRGGVIEDMAPYLGAEPDLGPYLDRIAVRHTSEFIFLAGNRSEAEVALRGIRARGLRLTILGGDGLEGIERAGPLAEGVFVSSAYLAGVETPRNQAFLTAYRARYPGAPPPNQAAAASYDILYLLRDVIARTGPDRARIRDGLAAIGSAAPVFEGVTGAIAFDPDGDVPDQPVYIGRVAGGKIEPVEGS